LRVNLIPYTKIDGVPTLKDSHVMDLYDRMVSDGVAASIFEDGTINSREEFLFSVTSGHNILYLVMADDEPAIALWLNNFQGKSVQMHWTCFSKFWGKGSVPIMQYALNKIINMTNDEGEFVWDVLIGLIPVSNPRAIQFAKKCGAWSDVTIPHALFDSRSNRSVDAALIYFTRELNEKIQTSKKRRGET
jgi:hypothetical protein